MRRHVVIQRLLVGGLFVSLCTVAARFFAIQGWVVPARVTSGSMAPSLLGEHFWSRCGECGFRFQYGVESKPREERAVCPNCGFNGNQLKNEFRDRGQRVLIDRGAYWFGAPARFDVVAFSDPARPSRLIVKRVAGLPGEKIAIRNGELWINGDLIRKGLTQFRAMSVVVHDNRHLARHDSELRQRWKPIRANSAWAIDGNTFRSSATGVAGSVKADLVPDADWLAYQHWRCYASSYPRFQLAPISDNSGYDQGESRALQDVTDVIVRCAVTATGSGLLAVRIHDGREWFTLRLEPSRRRVEILQSQQKIASGLFPEKSSSDAFVVEFGLLDEQVIFGLDSREVIREQYKPHSESRKAIAEPLAISSDMLDVAIREIVIKRDIYYLDPANIGRAWQSPTAVEDRSYFMLGDNPSLSEDSRQWKEPFIPITAIRGKVIPWR
jgi:signal peptidase I